VGDDENRQIGRTCAAGAPDSDLLERMLRGGGRNVAAAVGAYESQAELKKVVAWTAETGPQAHRTGLVAPGAAREFSATVRANFPLGREGRPCTNISLKIEKLPGP